MFEFWLLVLAVLLGVQSVLKTRTLLKGKKEKVKIWLHIVEIFIIIAVFKIAICGISPNGIFSFLIGGCLGLALCFKLLGMYNDYK